ncbi:MAG TPA: uL15 family ribosomal protein [Candidatus Nanoarchaeia archaeon]|nr:uL15 family ribosomal protein [Candidatus Nanoarchaeia archaeon]
MTINKRKKNSRLRGSWTHGWGAKKKHRGAGHRGGRGRAGSGKRADTIKPSLWKEELPKGFTSKVHHDVEAITISTINAKLGRWRREQRITPEGKGFRIRLDELGYQKLLSTGKPIVPLFIMVKAASARSMEKVAQAGGNVELLAPAPKEE